MSESVSEKAKLIRGDPPKIDFKKKGEPPKNNKKANKVKKWGNVIKIWGNLSQNGGDCVNFIAPNGQKYPIDRIFR